MAKSKKETDKKPAKETSNIFHNTMKASVKDNPKPAPKADTTQLQLILKHIQEEIAMVVPDYDEYVVLTISLSGANQLFYNINDSCPIEKSQKIERIILENADLLKLHVITSYDE